MISLGLSSASAARAVERDGACSAGQTSDASSRHATRLLAIAGLVLGLGLFVYMSDRDLSRSAWIPGVLALPVRGVFGAAGGWMPGFAHAFGFSLITAAWIPLRRSPAYPACLWWAFVDVAIEGGQHPVIRTKLAQAIQTAIGTSPVALVITRYFTRGTFDTGDVAAALLGGATAAVVLFALQPCQKVQS